MSNPSRLQQRSTFRSVVRIRRNYRVLPPISANNRPATELSSSSLSVDNVDVTCQTPTDDFWLRLRRDLDKHKAQAQTYNRGNQRTENKIVRIFVSSTFTDFFNEREVLIKKVFPALRDEMEKFGIQIIDCDLRWGVPKDSTTEQTILTCLEELDRCFEENGQPFFIGLISDKFGWVPQLKDLSKELSQRYHWIDGASITLMEFIHGVFRTQNPNALFLIREFGNIFPNLPEKFLDKFRDRDEFSQTQIEKLKEKISDFVPQDQIFRYDCFYAGLDSSTGRERVKLDGFVDFEESAKNFLRTAIEKWYPECFKEANQSSSDDQKQMNNFLLNKTQFYVDRTNEFSSLIKYVSNDRKNLRLIQGTEASARFSGLPDDDGYHRPLMLVKGRSGQGKTVLLSRFVLYIEEKMKEKSIIFHYFLDATQRPNPSEQMAISFCAMLEEYLKANNLIQLENGARLSVDEESFLQQAVKLISKPIIIIVDGLEKGDVHQQRFYNHEFPLYFMKQLRSDHTFIILSCETNARLFTNLEIYDHYEIDIEPLTIDQRRSYAELFFRRYNKTLEPEQLNLLIENKASEFPLYLSCVCENLRQFGDYSLVTNRLKAYPQVMDDLFDFLLDEAYRTVDNRPILDAFFKLLIISNVGIVESDIVDLLKFYFEKNSDSENSEKINPMLWSTIRRHIKEFLDTTWILGHQSIILRHASFEKQLRQRLFTADTDEPRVLHQYFAEFFHYNSSSKSFGVRQIPYHYEKAHMFNKLVEFLRSPESRGVPQVDRRLFMMRRRCNQILMAQDGLLSQRAYVCNVCAMQFKLGPFTMAKSSCAICTNMIMGASHLNAGMFKREARLCQKHGSQSYPNLIQCFVCKMMRQKPQGKTPSIGEPVPLNICMQCANFTGGPLRCCGLDIS